MFALQAGDFGWCGTSLADMKGLDDKPLDKAKPEIVYTGVSDNGYFGEQYYRKIEALSGTIKDMEYIHIGQFTEKISHSQKNCHI